MPLIRRKPCCKRLTHAIRKLTGCGNGGTTSCKDDQFAGAMATLTIHHWTDLTTGFKEIHRVLMDDGRFVLFTSLPEQTSRYWLAHYFPTLIEASAKQLPAMEVIESAAAEAGFTITQTEKYFVQPDLQDLFLYSGKFQPERYFDDKHPQWNLPLSYPTQHTTGSGNGSCSIACGHRKRNICFRSTAIRQ